MLVITFGMRPHPQPRGEVSTTGRRMRPIVNCCVQGFTCQTQKFNIHHCFCTPDLAALYLLLCWEPHKMKISEKVQGSCEIGLERGSPETSAGHGTGGHLRTSEEGSSAWTRHRRERASPTCHPNERECTGVFFCFMVWCKDFLTLICLFSSFVDIHVIHYSSKVVIICATVMVNLCVYLTGPWGSQIFGSTWFWECLWGCFWMRITFESVDWIK